MLVLIIIIQLLKNILYKYIYLIQDPFELYESIKEEGNKLITDYIQNSPEYKRLLIDSKIIPIYLFSLNSSFYDKELSFPNNKYYHSFSDGVLILQTLNEYKKTDFYTNTQPIYIDSRQCTDNILAALFETVGNINPPYKRYSSEHKREVYNYLLIHGSNPFSVFNSYKQLSYVYYHVSKKNKILAELTDSIISMRKALGDIEIFAKENYLYIIIIYIELHHFILQLIIKMMIKIFGLMYYIIMEQNIQKM